MAKLYQSEYLHKIYTTIGRTFSNNDVRDFITQSQLSALSTTGLIKKTDKTTRSTARKGRKLIPIYEISDYGLSFMRKYS